MHSQAGGLVDGQQVIVFKQHNKLPCRCVQPACGQVQRFAARTLRGPYRRQTNQVPGLHPGIGSNTAPVKPHLTAANDAVDMGFWHTFELPNQKIVQALPGAFFVDGQRFCLRLWHRRCGRYNLFHQRCVLSV